MCLVLPSGAGFCPSTVPVGPAIKLIECSALAPHSSKKKSKVPDRSCVAQDEIYKQFCLEQNDLETSISCLPGGPIDLTFLPDIERSSFHNPNKKNTHVLNNCQVCIHTSYLTNLRVYHGNLSSKNVHCALLGPYASLLPSFCFGFAKPSIQCSWPVSTRFAYPKPQPLSHGIFMVP